MSIPSRKFRCLDQPSAGQFRPDMGQMRFAGARRPGEDHHRRWPVRPIFNQLERRAIGLANDKTFTVTGRLMA